MRKNDPPNWSPLTDKIDDFVLKCCILRDNVKNSISGSIKQSGVWNSELPADILAKMEVMICELPR